MQSKTLHLISIFMKQILYLGTLGIIYDHLKTKKNANANARRHIL